METAAKPLPPPIKEFLQRVRSDDLPKFAAMLRRFSLPGASVDIYQVDVILDANIVIRELLTDVISVHAGRLSALGRSV